MAWSDVDSMELILDSPGISVTPTLAGAPITGSEESLGSISGSFFGSFAFQCNSLVAQIGIDISLDGGSTWSRLIAAIAVLATDKTTWAGWTPFAIVGGSSVKVRAVAVGVGLGSIQVQYVEFFRKSV